MWMSTVVIQNRLKYLVLCNYMYMLCNNVYITYNVISKEDTKKKKKTQKYSAKIHILDEFSWTMKRYSNNLKDGRKQGTEDQKLEETNTK